MITSMGWPFKGVAGNATGSPTPWLPPANSGSGEASQLHIENARDQHGIVTNFSNPG